MGKYCSITIAFVIILGGYFFMYEQKNTNKDMDAGGLQIYLTNSQQLQVNQHGSLLFTGNDIEEYKWEEQEIVFKTDFLKGRESNCFDKECIDYLLSSGSKLLGAKSTDMFEIILPKIPSNYI